MKTRVDLINQALGNLGVLAAGQTPAAEDVSAVDDHVDALIASLAARNIVTVDDDDEIPDEWFIPLATLLADAAADVFGLPGLPTPPGGQSQRMSAEMELREINYGRPTFEKQKAEYF